MARNGKLWQFFSWSGTLDEHMHLLLPALIRLFKVDASVDIRRAAIKTLTSLIPRVQVSYCACFYSPSVFKNWLVYARHCDIFTFHVWSLIVLVCYLILFPFYHQVTGHISSLVHHLKLVLDGWVWKFWNFKIYVYVSDCPSIHWNSFDVIMKVNIIICFCKW